MGFKGKVYVPDGGTVPNLATHGASLADSIFTRIITYFATETERTTETTSSVSGAGVKMTNAQKLGMKCWVDSRKGYYFWDGAEWQPEPQHNVVFEGTRAAAADSSGASLVDIITGMASTALPAGARKLEIHATSQASAIAVSTSGGVFATVQVTGPGISASDVNAIAGPLTFIGAPGLCHRIWNVVASGNVQYQMKGKDGNPLGQAAVRFSNSFLSVFDLGPAD